MVFRRPWIIACLLILVPSGAPAASGFFGDFCAGLFRSFDFPAALSTVKSDWREVSLESLSDRAVLVEYSAGPMSENAFIYGRAERIELVPGYTVLRVTDRNGSVHFLDPNKAKIGSIYEAPEKLSDDFAFILTSRNRASVSSLDESVVKAHFCGRLKTAARDPETLQLRRFVDRHFKYKALQSHNVGEYRCLVGVTMAASLQGASLISRAVTSPGTWVHDHSSNFVYSIGYMAALDQCLQNLAPQERSKILALTLGAGVAGNVWEEVKIPHVGNRSLPIFNSAGKKVETDIGDLESGILGNLTYVAAVKALETYSPHFVFWQYCR